MLDDCNASDACRHRMVAGSEPVAPELPSAWWQGNRDKVVSADV